MTATATTQVSPAMAVLDMTHEERVGRGADLLSGVRPNWRAQLDPDRLDLADTSTCPLGQLWGDYYEGLDALGITSAYESASYGFSKVFGPLDLAEPPEAWDALRSAWLTEAIR